MKGTIPALYMCFTNLNFTIQIHCNSCFYFAYHTNLGWHLSCSLSPHSRSRERARNEAKKKELLWWVTPRMPHRMFVVSMQGECLSFQKCFENRITQTIERLVLPCATLIFGATLPTCSDFGDTAKCIQELGKAGQTTGVSNSTHGPMLSIWAMYLLSQDHIFIYRTLKNLLCVWIFDASI